MILRYFRCRYIPIHIILWFWAGLCLLYYTFAFLFLLFYWRSPLPRPLLNGMSMAACSPNHSPDLFRLWCFWTLCINHLLLWPQWMVDLLVWVYCCRHFSPRSSPEIFWFGGYSTEYDIRSKGYWQRIILLFPATGIQRIGRTNFTNTPIYIPNQTNLVKSSFIYY